MSRITGKEYQRLLEQAGDSVEQEADGNLMAELIAERLNLLEAGDSPSEAEQAAAMAESPVRLIGEHRQKPLSAAAVKFCQGVIEGKTKRQAYRDAYPNAKGSDSVISASAYKLMQDPRVQRMIEAAWEETTDALVEDVVAQKRYVNRALVALSKGGKTESTRLRALELLGKAAGLFKDTQQQADRPVTADELRRELAGHLKLVATAGKKPTAPGNV